MIRALGVGDARTRSLGGPTGDVASRGETPRAFAREAQIRARRPNLLLRRARRETAASGRVRTCTRRRRRSTSRSTESAACSKCPRGRACVVPSAVARERRTRALRNDSLADPTSNPGFAHNLSCVARDDRRAAHTTDFESRTLLPPPPFSNARWRRSARPIDDFRLLRSSTVGRRGRRGGLVALGETHRAVPRTTRDRDARAQYRTASRDLAREKEPDASRVERGAREASRYLAGLPEKRAPVRRVGRFRWRASPGRSPRRRPRRPIRRCTWCVTA